MIAHRFLLPGFLLLILAPMAGAQAPPVANAPVPDTEFLRTGGGDPVPDTTAPWRYFPLAVGDAWEYDRYPTGLPHIDLGTRRVDIEKDTLIEGTRYVIHRDRFYDADGELESGIARTPIRFDTLTATVREAFMGGERIFRETHCPFDLPFDAEVLCGEFPEPYFTYGGYDEGTLAFPDTSFSVTYKAYSSDLGFVTSYAADYGEFALSFDNGDTHMLKYMRIGGEEYGAPQFPLPNEPAPPDTNRLRLEAYPNPFRERLTVAVNGATGGLAEIELIDMLGRTVRRERLGWGEHTLDLSGEGLAPGVYLVRIRTGTGDTATKKVLKL